MVELTLDDLMRWKSDLFRLAGTPGDSTAALDAEVSWAVCIRSAAPVLPLLRGKELVIVPDEILEELAERESIDWRNLAEHLRALPISGVITDNPDIVAGVSDVVIFEALAPIGPDLELELNREFTERRGSLYQLGSDLARTFSSASIGRMDLHRFLQLAGQRMDLPIALMTETGRVLAASPADLSPPGQVVSEESIARRVSAGGLDWISQPVSGAGLPGGVLLVAGLPPEMPGDHVRLVLEQTGEALGLIFDQLPPVDSPAPENEAGQILGDLVEGGVLPPAARRRLVQLAPDVDFDHALRLLLDLGRVHEPTSNMLSFQVDEVWMQLVDEANYESVVGGGTRRYIASAPFRGVEALPAAVSPVLKAFTLHRNGVVSACPVDLGMPGSGGAYGALLAFDQISRDAIGQLAQFADAMLGRLESYDEAHGMNLVETLGAYLDAGATVATAAERLSVHRNTLSYRLARVAAISGHDLADPSVRFDLQLAVAIRRVQSA